MKQPIDMNETELRHSFDFSKAARGRFAERYREGPRITLLERDPDKDAGLKSGTAPGSTRHSGKRFFESQILAAGLRLVEPPSKNGVDYLIYTGNSSNGKGVAYPVKVKTSIHEVFALHKRDSRIPRLLVAYVWHANEPERSSVYALTFEEALRIVESKPYIVSKAWNEDGGYSVTHAGAELKEMLKTYRMSPERWTQRLQSL